MDSGDNSSNLGVSDGKTKQTWNETNLIHAICSLCSYIGKLLYWKRKSIPGPVPLPFVGSLWRYLMQPVKDVEHDLIMEHGPLMGMMEGASPVLLVSDPRLVDEIFVRKFSVFSDNKNYFFHRIIVQGLSTINGAGWRRQRKIIGPAFTQFKLRPLVPRIQSCLLRLQQHLDRQIGGQDSATVDMKDVMNTFMIDVVSRILFAVDGDPYSPDSVFAAQVKQLTKIPISKLIAFTSFPVFLLEWMEFNLYPDGPSNFLIRLLESVVKERKESNERVDDFIDLLLHAHSDDGAGLSEGEVMGNMMQFFMAGFDTTSGTLSAACHSLAVHPEIQERLRSEMEETDYTLTDASKDSFLNAFIQEVLRMYPHAVRIDRVSNANITLTLNGKEVTIDAGTRVRLPIYHMNHDADTFQDPEQFDPDRFMTGGRSCDKRIYTFAAGSRNCVGENFARLVIRMTLTHLMKHFQILRSDRTTDQLDFSSSNILLHAKSNFITLKKV